MELSVDKVELGEVEHRQRAREREGGMWNVYVGVAGWKN